MDFQSQISEYLNKEIEVLRALDTSAISEVMNLLVKTFEAERTIYVFGNGGSAATASHYVNDFNKGISEYTEKKFRFVCLNDNVPTVLAIANDIGYEEVYRFQLRGRLNDGDIVIGISGSGNSPNIINAVNYAKERGCKVIGLTGFDGGELKKICDISLHAPVNSMQITEDVHMIFDHLIMAIFYKTLCNKEHLSY
ncbi:MAG: SIS domain-containing protein [Oscillospiraceae bacterium]|jgi:D-sedoheptulose 7-phosphate isomerase|nr:SIS domain-containing protein [Oscillospiraceae bacterium]